MKVTRLFCIMAGLVLGTLAQAAHAGTWSELRAGGMVAELFVPATAPAKGDRRALMVSLHGCVQDGALLRQRGNWASTADTFGMVVALPTVPDGGKIAGCWDYYGKAQFPFMPDPPKHTRTNRDNENLLDLVEVLLANPDLNIDPAQVYLTGLSSGGGQTLVLGCLAPEIFAGIGVVAGPTLGTGASEINPPGGFLPVSRAQAVALCRDLAGEHGESLETQIASMVYGADDGIAAPGYSVLNADVMAQIYGANPAGSFAIDELQGFEPEGLGKLWADQDGPRVSLIRVDGMGHAWPAGSGPGPERQFVASEGPNYPAYVTAFFFDNSRRVLRPPSLEAAALVEDRIVTLSGAAASATDGAVELSIEITGLSDAFSLGPVIVLQPNPPSFSWTSDPLTDDTAYEATVTAKDGDGNETAVTRVFGIGNAPFAPVVDDVSVVVDQDRQCAAILGTASDRNGDLARVEVSVDGGAAQEAVLNQTGDGWTLQQPVCGLAVGAHRAVVTAIDEGGLESRPAETTFDVKPIYDVVSDTLTGHVIAQRIRFYPDAGFGTADVPYPTLLQQHSLFEAFPLYGLAGRWYANPQNVLADMATLSGLATRPKPFALPSMMDAPAQETSLEEFVSTLKGTGARISIEVKMPEPE